ncbi:MAG: magnesium transporter [Burkholderiales bacterium]|nr:magnesium transporter [Burkholderiales bacterium]
MPPPTAPPSESAESASRHLARRVLLAAPDETIGTVVERLHGQALDYAGTIYVTDEARRLVGIVPMARLLSAPADARVAEVALRDFPAAQPDTDQEDAASLAIRYGVAAVPVVDASGRLLGVVPPQALLEVLRHEHVEDLHRLAGILHETERARLAIEAPPVRRARDRLPWLLVGLAGASVATLVVAWFERALESRVALAFFVPGIVYLADAIGTQTESIAVRGLSLSTAPIPRLVAGELRTGVLIGLTLSVLAFAPIWLALGDLRLAAAVSIALFAASSVATTVGLFFPWLLSRLGKDPAYGSGPVATIIQDVLSLLIYFGVVSLLAL